MTCPACGRPFSGTSHFCPHCEAFLADPAHAVRPSKNRSGGAALIDAAGWAVPFLGLLLSFDTSGGSGAGSRRWLAAGAAIVVAQLILAIRGQTIGMALLRLQLQDTRSGQPAGPVTMIMREVAALFSTITLIGYVWAMFHRGEQALHDKLTNSVVVHVLKYARPLRPANAPPVPATPIPARPRSKRRDGFTLAQPRVIVPAVIVLLLFVGSKVSRTPEPVRPDDAALLRSALHNLSLLEGPSRSVLETIPSDPKARVLWTRYAASVDIRHVLDSAYAAHGLPRGFGPPNHWPTDEYLEDAARHPEIGVHWESYLRFDDALAATMPGLARAAVERRAAQASLDPVALSELRASVDTLVNQQVRVWEQRRKTAQLGVDLHRKLVDENTRLSKYEVLALPEVAAIEAAHYEMLDLIRPLLSPDAVLTF